jgi:hypothetical protein
VARVLAVVPGARHPCLHARACRCARVQVLGRPRAPAVSTRSLAPPVGGPAPSGRAGPCWLLPRRGSFAHLAGQATAYSVLVWAARRLLYTESRSYKKVAKTEFVVRGGRRGQVERRGRGQQARAPLLRFARAAAGERSSAAGRLVLTEAAAT